MYIQIMPRSHFTVILSTQAFCSSMCRYIKHKGWLCVQHYQHQKLSSVFILFTHDSASYSIHLIIPAQTTQFNNSIHDVFKKTSETQCKISAGSKCAPGIAGGADRMI